MIQSKPITKKLPTGVTVTKRKGQDGLAYVDENNNIQIIESPKNAEIEIGTGDKADYVGKMTGYGCRLRRLFKRGNPSL